MEDQIYIYIYVLLKTVTFQLAQTLVLVSRCEIINMHIQKFQVNYFFAMYTYRIFTSWI